MTPTTPTPAGPPPDYPTTTAPVSLPAPVAAAPVKVPIPPEVAALIAAAKSLTGTPREQYEALEALVMQVPMWNAFAMRQWGMADGIALRNDILAAAGWVTPGSGQPVTAPSQKWYVSPQAYQLWLETSGVGAIMDAVDQNITAAGQNPNLP